MRIYYSVSNGGDGSAYPHFYESKLLADMHQSFENEWGESCTGHLDIEGDNIVVKDIITAEIYLKELEEELSYEDEEHLDEYPDDEISEIGDTRNDATVTLYRRYIRMLKEKIKNKK